MTRSSRHSSASRQKASSLRGEPALGKVRIIGGQWRGRKLSVPSVTGLRPTGDRVRETLFNWLQLQISGARCLDLFAGSGALGLEALSRHANCVTFVESNAVALRHISQSCRLLNVETIDLAAAQKTVPNAQQSLAYLYGGTAESAMSVWSKALQVQAFDVVFIDPPFESACQWSVLQALVPSLLADSAWIYVEAPHTQAMPETLPQGCEITKEKKLGEVIVRLIKYCKLG